MLNAGTHLSETTDVGADVASNNLDCTATWVDARIADFTQRPKCLADTLETSAINVHAPLTYLLIIGVVGFHSESDIRVCGCNHVDAELSPRRE